MTIFLQMPIVPNNPIYTYEGFKARYLEVTGERIQSRPLENAQGTHYMVGSSRITQAQAAQLASEFPMVTITNNWPVAWVGKNEEPI